MANNLSYWERKICFDYLRSLHLSSIETIYLAQYTDTLCDNTFHDEIALESAANDEFM